MNKDSSTRLMGWFLFCILSLGCMIGCLSPTVVEASGRREQQVRLLEQYKEDIENERRAADDAKARVSTETLRDKVIVIDPGHGGSDSGAVGSTGLREKDVALAVALRLEQRLKEAGANVVMTRREDVDVYGKSSSGVSELQARVDVGSNTHGADVFLSIHCNAFTSPKANGTETFFHFKSSSDQKLATFLQKELVRSGGLTNRGVKQANFYVLKHSPMPAALVELAFISNPIEESHLASADFQQEMAEALLRGLANYFRS